MPAFRDLQKMPKTVRYEELNTGDFEAAGFDKVLVPVGSCEAHGDHLPFGTDAYVAYDLALAVAARVPSTMVLPPTWFGMSHHYRHKPMCVSLSHETTIALFFDILTSVIDWGLRKILMINGHDGNVACAEIAAQRVKIAHPEVGIALLGEWWTAGFALLPKDTWDAYDGYGHGGDAETSIAMAMIPHLVDPSRARGMVDKKDRLVKELWNYQELTDYGATGLGTVATREKGERMRQVIVDHLVDFLNRKDAEGWVIPKREA
jgi:creatinine amidohydrolase